MHQKLKFLFPIVLAFLISLAISYFDGAIGVDVHFHLQIAEEWTQGQGFLSHTAMEVNKMPYPPLLHWILIPSVLLGNQAAYVVGIQVFLYPMAIASAMYLCAKTLGKQYAFYLGFLLLGSYAFFDRSFQVAPQAIDFILLPLAMLYAMRYDRRDRIKYAIASAVAIWNHGIVMISALGGTFLKQLRRRQYKTLIAVAVLASPVIILSAIYLPSALGNFGSSDQNLQETQFWQNPFTFTMLYQRLPFAGFFVAGWMLYKHFKGKQQLSSFAKLNIASIASMALMIPVWPDRWVQFTTIPLSLLIIEHMTTTKTRYRDAWLIGIMFAFLFFYYTLWIWLAAGSYQT